MKHSMMGWTRGAAMALAAISICAVARAEEDKSPAPPVVAPAKEAGGAPADAIILFDGKNFSNWLNDKGAEKIEWTIEESGAMKCKPHAGSIQTKEKFGDVQLHVEFSPPIMLDKQGQDRGNSGVYLQGRYEVQVLDSYQSETYHNGQCGAIYSEHPPLANVCRPPGEWQTYDIIFRAPRFDAAGKRTAQGTFTVFQNGVLIHDRAPVGKSTTASLYKEAPGDGPLVLQDHWNDVRYRNIWIRKLAPESEGN